MPTLYQRLEGGHVAALREQQAGRASLAEAIDGFAALIEHGD